MHLTFGEPCSNTLSGRESNFKTDQVPRSRTRLRLANISDPSRVKVCFPSLKKAGHSTENSEEPSSEPSKTTLFSLMRKQLQFPDPNRNPKKSS